jgi:hypothetical protein
MQQPVVQGCLDAAPMPAFDLGRAGARGFYHHENVSI